MVAKKPFTDRKTTVSRRAGKPPAKSHEPAIAYNRKFKQSSLILRKDYAVNTPVNSNKVLKKICIITRFYSWALWETEVRHYFFFFLATLLRHVRKAFKIKCVFELWDLKQKIRVKGNGLTALNCTKIPFLYIAAVW